MQLRRDHFGKFPAECDRHFSKLNRMTCRNACRFHTAHCNWLRISLHILAFWRRHLRMGHEFHLHDARMA